MAKRENLYMLLKVENFMMTRNVWLRNLQTNETEVCFDDSDLEEDGFSFMKIGEIYTCKIDLFGKASRTPLENYQECRIVRREVPIGKKIRTEIRMDGGIYYIPKQDICFPLSLQEPFYYMHTRKNLIQVDDKLHFDYRE